MEVCAPKSKIFKTYITSSAILYGDSDALISIFIVVHKLPFLLYALTYVNFMYGVLLNSLNVIVTLSP